ncbi:mitochondrial carrier domain-containing protein [Sporodiniella umbellata]|nr:mitochondrial carrier domain-containing protein [Sporodiniella umbellata]
MSTIKVNPHRPYYSPGIHHYNYTSLSSADSIAPYIIEDTHKHDRLTGLTTRCTSFALVKYFVTMLISPFDVGTTLLQVQYSPHEDVEVLGPAITEMQSLQNSHFSDEEEEEEEDTFYRKPERLSLDTARLNKNEMFSASVYDNENRPIHQMAPMQGGGVLEILRLIVRQPTEGWKSLFKGQRVTWVYEMLRTILRPALEGSLNDLFGLYDDTIPLMHLDNVTPNITTLVASHLVVGVLLSPLEIVRTRIVVQSASPLYSKYKGPIHALRTVFAEEGGIQGVYLSKNLVPTLLYHGITPLLSCSSPLIIARILGISAVDSPVLYGAAEFALSTLGLLMMLPLETIRKRLQCQVPSRSEPFKSTVALRPVAYRGVLDAVYKIMKEEGTRNKSSLSKKSKRDKARFSDSDASDTDEERLSRLKVKSVTSAWGIHGLYRGFTMQLAANAMVFVFQAMNGLEGNSDIF